MRTATSADTEQLVQCIAAVSRFVKTTGSDPYIRGLPNEPNPEMWQFASRFTTSDDAFAILVEEAGQINGCLAGMITPTSFPPSNVGLVGTIEVCWVHEEQRKSGLAKRLVTAAEERFRDAGVSIIELSYLATNSVAAAVWEKLGYSPFRVHSYKQLP